VASTAQTTNSIATGEAGSELRSALARCRSAIVGIGFFSGLINLLTLTGSLFMLEVYDRVLPGRSIPTLVGLAIITALLFVFQAIMEIIRGRMLVRIGNQIDWRLSDRVYDLVIRLPLRARDVLLLAAAGSHDQHEGDDDGDGATHGWLRAP